MGENQESTVNIIENLALVTDAIQTMFPDGKIICVYELKEKDFKKVQNNFRKIDSGFNRFSVDMSGTEHVFINSSFQPLVETKNIKPKSFREKLSSWFKSGRLSIK